MKRVLAHIDTLPPLPRQLARFILTGGVNTVFAYLVYVFMAGTLDIPYLSALLFSWAIGVAFSYSTFRAFVFTDGSRSFKTFARFLPTYIFLLILNLSTLYIFVDIEKWDKLAAQALIVPFCAALSFIINRLFVFRVRTP
jgi:putative flippase GtrA